MTILFVCSGNTCRSPLAVAAWHALESEENAASSSKTLAQIEVASAGLAARKGAEAAHYAQKIARQWNTDLSGHRARILGRLLTQSADLIVTMTQQQAQATRRQFGLPLHRVRVLGEFNDEFRVLDIETHDKKLSEDARLAALLNDDAPSDFDIDDPFGASLEAYESCANHIKSALKNLRQTLRDGAIVP